MVLTVVDKGWGLDLHSQAYIYKNEETQEMNLSASLFPVDPFDEIVPVLLYFMYLLFVLDLHFDMTFFLLEVFFSGNKLYFEL